MKHQWNTPNSSSIVSPAKRAPHYCVFHRGPSVCMVSLMVTSRAPRVMHAVYYKMPTYAVKFNRAQPYQLIQSILYTYKRPYHEVKNHTAWASLFVYIYTCFSISLCIYIHIYIFQFLIVTRIMHAFSFQFTYLNVHLCFPIIKQKSLKYFKSEGF